MTTRRDLLRTALWAGLPLTLSGAARARSTGRLDPTPACGADRRGAAGTATPAQTEGPYFTPNSPRRTGLYEPGMEGTRLRVSGLALDPDCRPLPHVLVDLWQADAQGRYDNAGYRLRGHQFTDEEGRWQFDTVLPAIYPGRTRHLHVKLQPRGGKILTTQLYFPSDAAANARDRIFDRRLLLQTAGDAEQMIARYDFVLAAG